MKIISQILLFVFIAFLLTPTIVDLIEKDNDSTVICSCSDIDKEQKEIKAVFNFETAFEIIHSTKEKSNRILSENFSKHDAIASSIFIPPPDQV